MKFTEDCHTAGNPQLWSMKRNTGALYCCGCVENVLAIILNECSGLVLIKMSCLSERSFLTFTLLSPNNYLSMTFQISNAKTRYAMIRRNPVNTLSSLWEVRKAQLIKCPLNTKWEVRFDRLTGRIQGRFAGHGHLKLDDPRARPRERRIRPKQFAGHSLFGLASNTIYFY